MNIALIKNGVVKIVAVFDEMPESFPGYDTVIDLTTTTPRPGPGWTYDGQYFTRPVTIPKKSIYTRSQFIAMIPKAKVRQIQTAMATNDDINVWVFNLPMVTEIDLNNLPAWFTAGMLAMVTENIITQAQAEAFLEI